MEQPGWFDTKKYCDSITPILWDWMDLNGQEKSGGTVCKNDGTVFIDPPPPPGSVLRLSLWPPQKDGRRWIWHIVSPPPSDRGEEFNPANEFAGIVSQLADVGKPIEEARRLFDGAIMQRTTKGLLFWMNKIECQWTDGCPAYMDDTNISWQIPSGGIVTQEMRATHTLPSWMIELLRR
jgi:hypothetical protein